MPNIINPNCLSLPQQVEKNRQDILKILASNLEELTGLQFIPNNIIYQNQNAILNGKFIVVRDDSEVEIDGVVNIPIFGENGVIVDAGSENLKLRIALDQSDRELFDYVQELVNRTTESDEIVFTSDMENFVSEALENVEQVELIYNQSSTDIELNWGLTAGIYNNTINRDFSKYKRLRCYCSNSIIFEIPCDGNTCRMLTQCYNLGTNGAQYVYGIEGKATSSSLEFKSLNYQGSQTVEGVDFIGIFKIEGVF